MINGISYVISTKRKQTWRWLQPIHTILHNVTPITVALWISDQQSHDVEVPLSESWSPDVSLKMFGKCCWWFTGCFFHSCGCDSPEEERSALMKDINPTAQRPLRCFACSSTQNWICEKIIEWAHHGRVQPTSTQTHWCGKWYHFNNFTDTFAHLLYCITDSLRKPFVYIFKLRNLPST